MMKKIILSFFILISTAYSINLDSLNQFTGWKEDGQFQVQKLQIGAITYSKISDDGKLNNVERDNLSYLKADFKSDKDSIIQCQDVQFYNLSSSSVDKLFWDFGDGDQSTEINPRHIYKEPGNYTVKLIASKGSSSDTIIKNSLIHVNPMFYPIIISNTYDHIAPYNAIIKHNNDFKADSIIWKIDKLNLTLFGEEIEVLLTLPDIYTVEQIAYKEGMDFHTKKSFRVYDATNVPDLQLSLIDEEYGYYKPIGKGFFYNKLVISEFETTDNNIIYFVKTTNNYDYYTNKSCIHKFTDNLGKIQNVLEIDNYKDAFPYFRGGFIIKDFSNNLARVYDRNGVNLFERKIENFNNLFLVNDNFIITASYEKIIIYDKYFKLLKKISFEQLQGYKIGDSLPQIIHKEQIFSKGNRIVLPVQFRECLNLLSLDWNMGTLYQKILPYLKINNSNWINDTTLYLSEEKTGKILILNKDLNMVFYSKFNFSNYSYLENNYFIRFYPLTNNKFSNTIVCEIIDIDSNIIFKKILDSIPTFRCYTTISRNGILFLRNEFLKLDFESVLSYKRYRVDLNLKILSSVKNESKYVITNCHHLYPNPSYYTINLQLQNKEFRNVKCIDLLGEEYKVQFNYKPNNELEINISYLPKGIYLLIVEYENNSIINKFIKE